MKTRIIAAVALLPILLFIVLALPTIYTAVLFGLAASIAAYELLWGTGYVKHVRLVAYAALMAFLSIAEMKIVPSSSMSTFAPDSATIFWMTLPPVPMTSRILSTLIFMDSIFGAKSETSARGASIALSMTSSMM